MFNPTNLPSDFRKTRMPFEFFLIRASVHSYDLGKRSSDTCISTWLALLKKMT